MDTSSRSHLARGVVVATVIASVGAVLAAVWAFTAPSLRELDGEPVILSDDPSPRDVAPPGDVEDLAAPTAAPEQPVVATDFEARVQPLLDVLVERLGDVLVDLQLDPAVLYVVVEPGSEADAVPVLEEVVGPDAASIVLNGEPLDPGGRHDLGPVEHDCGDGQVVSGEPYVAFAESLGLTLDQAGEALCFQVRTIEGLGELPARFGRGQVEVGYVPGRAGARVDVADAELVDEVTAVVRELLGDDAASVQVVGPGGGS